MTTADPLALVLLRDPRRAKSRLARVLGVDERAALVHAMLTDVVAAVTGAGVGRVVVLAGGDDAASAAGALGIDVLPDPPGGDGIDAAITAASRRLSAASSVVVPADLALLRAEDVASLLAHPGDIVVAPTSDGGTGGLVRRPAWVLPTSYGRRSAARHLLAARRAGLHATRADVAGFRLDVDDPADLAAALDADRLGPATARALGAVDRVGERVASYLRSSA